MSAPDAPGRFSTLSLERVAGSILLAGFALLIWVVALFAIQDPAQPAVQTVALSVTLLGLVVFAVALNRRRESPIAWLGVVAFALGSASGIAGGWIGASTGEYSLGMEVVYTVLACLAMAAFGWSILETKALPSAIGWFAIGYAVIDGFLYLARILIPPLAPNLIQLIFGLALVWPWRHGAAADPPVG